MIEGKRGGVGWMDPTEPEIALTFEPLRGESSVCSMCHRKEVRAGVVVRPVTNLRMFHVICADCAACIGAFAHDSSKGPS